MKTSNKILVAATLIVMAYLLVYDMALKAEYVKGAYKKPHYRMQQLSFANFNTIKHNAANMIGIQIEKGPYGVWVDNNLKDNVTVSLHNQVLQIDYTGKDRNYTGITISCPDVVTVTLNSTGKIDPQNFWSNGTVISGFNQPRINIQASHEISIELKNDTLTELNAMIGDQYGRSSFEIHSDNKIASANLQVPGKSKLKIRDLNIGKIAYKLSDSAEVTLTGKSVHILDKQ